MNAIEVMGVSKRIKKSLVIDQVSFSVPFHRIIGFQGVNGSGKTMMMRLIAGLLHPTAGEIRIEGQTLGKQLEFPPSLGVLIENPAFLEGYSGFRNLQILASIKNQVGEERIRQVLSIVGLEEAGEKKYRKYSLGMKQRLGIAAAILESPKILLLDEPTNALDTNGVALLHTIVAEEKARGAAVIVACHDAAFLSAVSDEIYHFELGNITEHTILTPASPEGGPL